MLLSGKDLSESTTRILKLIPVAAFSALVANDLLNDKVLHAHSMADLISLIACIPVIIVACKTKSLSLCILVGVVSYAALKFFI